MILHPCTRCSTPTPPVGLDDHGVCYGCRKPAPPPPVSVSTEEGVTLSGLMQDALDQASRTRVERALLKEDLDPQPVKADPLPAKRAPKGKEVPVEPPAEPTMADIEMARRVLCRRKLLPFVLRFNDAYDAGWVHHQICEALEQFERDVVAKRSPRLIIEICPRHGKSELVSRNFPAWFLGRNPKLELIAASHTTSLAMDFSRKVRGIVRNPAFKAVFPDAQMSEDSQAAEQWRTTYGGGYTAVGVGSAVVGKGCSVLLIDDPVAGSEDADSFKNREAVKNWYQTEAYTRLAPGGGVCIIMQRWHEDDLSGWLQARAAKGEGEEFKVIRFPAVAVEDEPYRKAGEALHPSRYPIELLEGIKRNMTPRQWEALYQQNPVPDDGSYFLRDHFRYYMPADLPELATMNVYSTWDLAIGLNEQNDYTAGIVFGLTRSDDIYILDLLHGRWSAMEIVEKVLDAQKQWNAQIVGLEKGHIQMTLGPFLSKRMAERKQMGFLLEPLSVGRRDKLARARSIQGRMQQGRVYWPKAAPWLTDTERELLRFPNGQHDDRVDALAYAGLLLESMVVSRPEPEKPKKSWMDRVRSATTANSHRSAMSA